MLAGWRRAIPFLLFYPYLFIMHLRDSHGLIAGRTLTERRSLVPTEQERQLLASYVLGHITLEEANELLHQVGRFIIAICEYPVATIKLA